MKDEQILNFLRERNHTKAFRLLYDYFPLIQKYVVQNNGNNEDAKDLFQQALLVFYQKISEGKYDHTAKISTFLYAICRNNWNKKLTRGKERHHIPLDEKHDLGFDDENLINEENQPTQSLKDFLSEKIKELGDPCQSILIFHEFYKLSMTNIAEKMGYKNENTVRQQKYKCLIRLRKLIPTDLKNAYLQEIQ